MSYPSTLTAKEYMNMNVSADKVAIYMSEDFNYVKSPNLG